MLKKTNNLKLSLNVLLFFFFTAPVITAYAQSRPPVSKKYEKFFAYYSDRRSIPEKILNYFNKSKSPIGRGFALIAGVSSYPNLPHGKKYLKPAEKDLEDMVNFLKEEQWFDEIVLLKDDDMNIENLKFFLQGYFPERLKNFPKSRFIFAYSGHGFKFENETDGYLLEYNAENPTDKKNSINLRTLKVFIDEVVRSGHHILILLNACKSGVFLNTSYGEDDLLPQFSGAHAITAGGSQEYTWQIPAIGEGSLFFETLISGIRRGSADLYPDDHPDGIIKVNELATYLSEEIQRITKEKQTPQQTPQMSDISIKESSRGSFFFIDSTSYLFSAKESPIDTGGIDTSRESFGKFVEDRFRFFKVMDTLSQKNLDKGKVDMLGKEDMVIMSAKIDYDGKVLFRSEKPWDEFPDKESIYYRFKSKNYKTLIVPDTSIHNESQPVLIHMEKNHIVKRIAQSNINRIFSVLVVGTSIIFWNKLSTKRSYSEADYLDLRYGDTRFDESWNRFRSFEKKRNIFGGLTAISGVWLIYSIKF